MMRYLDTSALAKAYLSESGSAVVRDMIAGALAPVPTARIVVSRLAFPEAVSAVARRERNARIGAGEAAEAVRWIEAAFTRAPSPYTVVEATAAIVARAARLVRPHGLRGFDAIHLATALAFRDAGAAEGFAFVTSDARLADAARAEGLTVIVPA